MQNSNRKHVTFSLPIATVQKLDEIADKHNMTKSGLINFYVQQTVAHDGNIFMQ